jgi:hypothetical protein
MNLRISQQNLKCDVVMDFSGSPSLSPRRDGTLTLARGNPNQSEACRADARPRPMVKRRTTQSGNLKPRGVWVDIISMAPVGFLACGPTWGMFLILGGLAVGSLVLIVSFVAGFCCLFTSRWKLGIWLTTVPGVITGLLYMLLQQQG